MDTINKSVLQFLKFFFPIIRFLHKCWRGILVFFNALTRILHPVDFALVNIAIVLIIFGMSQFQDVFAQLNLDEYEKQKTSTFFPRINYKLVILTFLWSFFLFYGTKLSLFKATIFNSNDLSLKYFKESEKNTIKKICLRFINEKSVLFLPSLFACLPPLIIVLGLTQNQVNDTISNNVITIGVVTFILFVSRYFRNIGFLRLQPIPNIDLDSDTGLSVKDIYQKISEYRFLDKVDNNDRLQKLNSSEIIGKVVIFIIALISIFFLLIYLFFLIFGIDILLNDYNIDSITIIILSALFWGFINFCVSFFNQRFKFSFYIIIMIWVAIASFNNNNHELRYSDFPKETHDSLIKSRPAVSQYIDVWVDSLIRDTTKIHDVFIISGEGGGLRAAYWASGLLNKMSESVPDFRRNTLAITGVSGSSLGIYINEKLYQSDSIKHRSEKIKEICEKDYLSPVTLGFTFRDAIQRFIPITIKNFDRTLFLENSFENQMAKILKKEENLLETGFLKDFGLNAEKPFRPMILFNTTEVELGRKAIISNADLGTMNFDKNDSFFDVIDVFKVFGRDMPLITAATASARFPVLTPPALVTFPTTLGNHDKGFHIVDGGYYENTGLHTAYQILKILNQIHPDKKKFIRPVVVFLKNGTPPEVIKKKIEIENNLITKPLGFAYEFSPLFAFVNAWDRKTHSIENDFLNNVGVIYQANEENRANFNAIHLSRKEENLPLGWDLSTIAVENMTKQLKENEDLKSFIDYYKK